MGRRHGEADWTFFIWSPKDLDIRPGREWDREWSLTTPPFPRTAGTGGQGAMRVCGGNRFLLVSSIVAGTLMKYCPAFRRKESPSRATNYIYVLGREHQQNAHQ